MNSQEMSWKAHINRYARGHGIAPQVVLQNIMFERFLRRLSRSDYKNHFVLKGGVLVAAIVGLDYRSTMLTSDSSLNRSTHVVEDPRSLRKRLLTPREAERLQGFDDDWTATGMPERMRYFCMGNALVVPMITRMGKVLDAILHGKIQK